MATNNVTRMLDAKKIRYTPHPLPAAKLSAVEVAEHLSVPLDIVFKTIVIKRLVRGKPILAVVPGNSEVDLKALAKVVGEKKVKMTTQKEAENLTGLIAGGISPLALINKGFQVILDASAKAHPTILVSGGQWGLNIELPPGDLIKLTNARPGKISKIT